MYTREQLSKYPYFAEILEKSDISRVTDSLTGLVARQYIIGFIHQLIDDKVPFSLAILDLDNFKFINDTYGHKIGDGVLAGVSSDLIKYLKEYGIAGRIGGDEFLIINFKDLDYGDAKAFYQNMYVCFNVLRKNIELETCNPFITGTIGSATFPRDASDYESLFELVDKALYRGKTKGRNCHIVYVESKHKNIQIKELAGRGIYSTFHNLSIQFDSTSVVVDKLKSMLDILKEDMRISDLYYIGEDNILKSVGTDEALEQICDLDQLALDDLYMTNEVEAIEHKSPSLYAVCQKRDFETVLLVKVGMQNATYGYLLCAEPRNLRIWQEDECAILFFVARMIAAYILGTGATF